MMNMRRPPMNPQALQQKLASHRQIAFRGNVPSALQPSGPTPGAMGSGGFAKGGNVKKGKMGDPAKLPTEKFSARAKRATLRGDDMGTYKKGGMTKMMGGGMYKQGGTTKMKKGGKC